MHRDGEPSTGHSAPALLERRCESPALAESYHYHTYGLRLSSQLALPELPATPHCGDPDIEILAQALSEMPQEAASSWNWFRLDADRCQLMLNGVARYRIEEGRRVLVDRRVAGGAGQAASAGDVRLYLLGTALGVLLHQRHWLPLHVSALQTPAGVWAFSGPSGAGKSTLGAWLHYTQGWPMVSDDVAVIKPQEPLPYLHPGPSRLKLWKDALDALGIARGGLVRDLTRADKYHLSLPQGFQARPQPLRALVMLERAAEGEPASLEPIEGVAAFKAVMASLYRPEMAQAFNGLEGLTRAAGGLAALIDVYRLRRPWSLDELPTSLAPLLRRIHAAGEAPASGFSAPR